jgi:uncharacterized membrane protein
MPHLLTKRQLLKKLDLKKIEDEIEAAEKKTTGEICVSVSPFFFGSVDKVARRAFDRLGVTGTKDRNGILFFVVPSRKRFVLLGDEGIHARVGQAFWDNVANAVSARFHEGDFTGGLLAGIRVTGEELARHFPADGNDNPNELPNRVDI